MIAHFKNWFLALVLSMVSVVSHGQIRAGIKAALNLNHTQLNAAATYRPGVAAGVFCHYDVAHFVFLNAELGYSQTGGGYDRGYYFIRPDIFRNNVDVTFHTVAVPLFAAVTLPSLSESTVKPLLLAGVEYGYSITAVESYENVYRYRGREFGSGDSARDASDDFSKHQPAMLFGAGADLTIRGLRTTIDLRYKMPFRKSDLPNGRSGRFKTLSVNVGVSLFDF